MAALILPTLEDFSPHAYWATLGIRGQLADIQRRAPVFPTENADSFHLFPAQNTLFVEHETSSFHIGIVGAGVAGLFTAMILDQLNEKFDLNATYEILEARGKDRLGGRLYSHYFPPRKDHPEIGIHDYYDVGAMRFPEIKIMDRTFALFKEIGINPAPSQDERHPNPAELIPYYFSGPNTPKLYNGYQIVGGNPTAETFHIPNIPPSIAAESIGDLLDDKIADLKALYYSGPNGPGEFWDKLLNEVDRYSVRQFLGLDRDNQTGYNYDTIEFVETLNSGNRWYDQAASEMVLEELDFDASAAWWCVEGGSQYIAWNMRKRLQNKKAVKFNRQVSAISYVNRTGRFQVDVSVRGEKNPRTYDAVFNSAPLGAMEHMQLEGLNLHYDTKRAIRSLGYGASSKVGVRFKNLWWIKHLNITQGGLGKTDLPIQTCVYPSYNVHDDPDQAGVLLVSYSWSQEAERIGSLINRNSPAGEQELKDLLIHDLARLHAATHDDQDYQRLHAIISDAYLDHHGYSWYNDKHAAGAFAYFGPGQFQNMYPGVTHSDGKHIIIGEAASAHHAWVVGSLESAVRGVYQFLFKHSRRSRAAAAAVEAYNNNEIPSPFGPLPAEYDRTQEDGLPSDTPDHLKKETLASSPLGELARQQVLFESIRLRQGGDVLEPGDITEEQAAPILQPLRS